MESTAREFTRNFRKLRAVAALGKTVRVAAPGGIYLVTPDNPKKPAPRCSPRSSDKTAKVFSAIPAPTLSKPVKTGPAWLGRIEPAAIRLRIR